MNLERVKMNKLTKSTKVLFYGLFSIVVGLSYSQLPMDGQACYWQTEEGSVVDLSSLCKEKPTLQESTPFMSMSPAQQDAILSGLSNEVRDACQRLSGKCESNTELIGVMKQVCSRPGHCPDYINQGLRNLK